MVFAGPPEDDIDWADVSPTGSAKFLARAWRLAGDVASEPGVDRRRWRPGAAPGHRARGARRGGCDRVVPLQRRCRADDGAGQRDPQGRGQRARRGRPGGPRGGRGGRGDAVARRAVHRRGHVGAARATSRRSRRAGWPRSTRRCWSQESVTCVVQVAGKVRDRLEVAPGIAEDALRALALGEPTRSSRRWRAARCARSSCARPGARQHRARMSGAPDDAGLDPQRWPAGSRWSPTRRRTCPPGLVADGSITVVPVQVVIGGDVVRRGRGHLARRGRRGAAVVAGRHDLAARRRSGSPRPTRRPPARARAASSRCTCPPTCPGRTTRRALAARKAGAAGPGGRQRTRRRWGSASRSSPRRPRPPTAPTSRRWRPPRGTAPRPPRRCSTSTPSTTCAGAAGSAPRRRWSGTALAVKPILAVVDGRIAPLEKVRTTSRALARLAELAVAKADGRPADIAVHHLDAQARADDARRPAALPRSPGRQLLVAEVGAVVGAHVGPGMIAVVVAPR